MVASSFLHCPEIRLRSIRMPFLFQTVVTAGFPSPAEDYVDQNLNLDEYLIEHPEATFFVRASGESMAGVGIASGDLLIVDRSLEPQTGNIVVAYLDGEFVVKRLELRATHARLLSTHAGYPPIVVTEENDFSVWGVVTFIIHKA